MTATIAAPESGKHHVAKLSHRSRPGYTGDLGEPAMRFDPIVGSDGLI
jgi:hypothetical protein